MKHLIGTAACLGALCWAGAAVPSEAKGTEWLPDVKKSPTPARPASGRISGKAFKVERAELDGANILSLRQGKEFFADREFKIFLFQSGAKLDGKTFTVSNTDRPGQMNPHVHMSWKGPKDSIPQTEMAMGKYAMRLQFGKRKNGKITGQIYLCMPDAQKSYVAGYFTAALKS
jgi:hypothetical protein